MCYYGDVVGGGSGNYVGEILLLVDWELVLIDDEYGVVVELEWYEYFEIGVGVVGLVVY